MNWLRSTAIVLTLIGTTACGYNENPPILVAVSDTVGVSVSAGAGEQGAEATMGVKARKFSIVPVSTSDERGNQQTIAIPTSNLNTYETHAVLTTLSVQGTAGTPGVSLEQIVAVGPAAKEWAKGRAHQAPPWAN